MAILEQKNFSGVTRVDKCTNLHYYLHYREESCNNTALHYMHAMDTGVAGWAGGYVNFAGWMQV